MFGIEKDIQDIMKVVYGPLNKDKQPPDTIEIGGVKSKMTETIQTLKEDIAILQEKLRKLEEQDPEMLLLRQGKVDFVDYNGKGGNKYIRIEYTDSFAGEYNWYVRKVGEDAIRPVRDVNVYAPLEELYQKEVVKQKDDYPYKKYTPEKTEKSLKEAFVKAQQTEEWKETQRKIDAPKESWMNKSDEELIAILEKNPPEFLKFELGKTLEELICKCMVDYNSIIPVGLLEDILNNIEKWLPDFQSHEGTQSASVIDLVDGYNDALTKIKSKLRNKK